MKISNAREKFRLILIVGASLLVIGINSQAQDSTKQTNATEPPPKPKPVKNTFGSQWIIENQTVMVPVKGTLELDFQHRFGVVGNGYQDFWGLFSPSFDIRIGASYSPVKNLDLGIGITKTGLLWDGSAKYAIIQQTNGVYPVSVTFFGDAAINTFKDAALYDGSPVMHNSDRWTFFSSLIIARKITDRLSVQITPSLSHQNAVGGYYTKNDTSGSTIYKSMYHDHFAIAVCARYKFSTYSSIIFDYDQPITKHPDFNPNPNLSLGIEITTSGHCFQMFVTNYSLLNPQNNNLWNRNSPFSYTDKSTGTSVSGGQWVIGFNLTKLWNY
jgi:hypothetical protein